MTCRFAHDDGAYVLGSLTPTERLEFERHLAGCSGCSRRVRELAGLTGLLARVPSEVLDEVDPDAAPPVPGSLLPGLVGTVRRDRRRRRRATAGLAVAAAAAGAVIGVVGAGAVRGGGETQGPGTASPTATQSPTPSPTQSPTRSPSSASASPSPSLAPARRMRPVAETTMTARLSLTEVPWGTRLDLTCSYPASDPAGRGGASYGGEEATTYTLVVRTRDGAVEQVATWRGLAGRTMSLTGATAAVRGRIGAVEVRTADGSPVLELSG
jgi:hypothetical protein